MTAQCVPRFRAEEGEVVERDARLNRMERGRVLMQGGCFKEALGYFLNAGELEPLNETELAEICYYTAECYAHMDEKTMAVEFYDEAISYDPSHLKSYFGRGYVLSTMRDHSNAIDDFTHYITMNPCPDHWAFFHRGWNLFCAKRYTQSINDFETALDLDARNNGTMDANEHIASWFIDALVAKTRTHMSKKEFQDAIAILSRLILLDPTEFRYIFSRGSAFLELGLYEEAKRDFQAAIDVDPRSYKAMVNKAFAEYKLKQFESAVASYTEALAWDPYGKEAIRGHRQAQKSFVKQHQSVLYAEDAA